MSHQSVMSRQSAMSVADLDLPQSCNSTVQLVHWTDLPLACPFPGTSLWNGHPRVYLPIHRTGREQCYYCGTVYILEELDPDAPIPEFSNNKIEAYYHLERERLLAGRKRVYELPSGKSA